MCGTNVTPASLQLCSHFSPCACTANKEEVAVLWEDQERINRFNRLHTRLQDVEDEIVEKKKTCDNIKSALSEMEGLMEDDACKIRVGEIYINVSNEEAEEYTKKVNEERKAEFAALLKEKVQFVFPSFCVVLLCCWCCFVVVCVCFYMLFKLVWVGLIPHLLCFGCVALQSLVAGEHSPSQSCCVKRDFLKRGVCAEVYMRARCCFVLLAE